MSQRRTRLAEGCYQDQYGIAAVVKVGRIQKEKRFPPDTDLDTLRRWRSEERARLLGDRQLQREQRADPRRFARAVATYLRTRKGRVGYKADRSHAKAWLPALGDKRRHLITTAEVQRVIAGWLEAGKAPKTIQHRVRVLRDILTAADGGRSPQITATLDMPTVSRPSPIPVSRQTIIDVAMSLATGKRHPKGYGADPIKSRARFLVYATTGQRPAQIGRALRSDVDLERHVWFVRPAKGGDPIPLPLSDDMVAAWQAFITAEAWGPFDTTSLAKLLRRHGWPVGIRPYMLRHTFAIDLLLAGADLGDIQGLLGHTHIQTTRDFYAPILISRLRDTVAKRPSLPAEALPADVSTPGENAPQPASLRTRRRTQKKASA